MARGNRYDLVAITLHWLIALGIAAQLVMGLAMVHVALPMAQKFQLFQLHKSVGITVLLAVLLRVLWRLTHRPPMLPGWMPRRERQASHGAHMVLYALMLGLPLSGWAVVSASVFNIPTMLYGVIPWPHLPVLATLTDKGPVENVLQWVHAWFGWSMIALLGLHVGAVARHVLHGDGILARMLPWTVPRTSAQAAIRTGQVS